MMMVLSTFSLNLVLIFMTAKANSQEINGTNEGDSCPLDCKMIGYCADFQRCVSINGTWKWDPVTESLRGEWRLFTCPGILMWNPNSTNGGSCDFLKNLPVHIRREYKSDSKCWPPCENKEHENMTSRCEGFYWSMTRANESSRILDQSELVQCPKGLIFNKVADTCTRCEDIKGQTRTRTECCLSGKAGGRSFTRRLQQSTDTNHEPKQKTIVGDDNPIGKNPAPKQKTIVRDNNPIRHSKYHSS